MFSHHLNDAEQFVLGVLVNIKVVLLVPLQEQILCKGTQVATTSFCAHEDNIVTCVGSLKSVNTSSCHGV